MIGTAPKGDLFQRVLSVMIWRVAKKAGAVTALSRPLGDLMVSRYKVATTILKIIPTCTDLAKFTRSEINLDSQIILLSGVFNDFYDLELTKEFIEIYKQIENVEVVWAHGIEALRNSLNVGEDRIVVLASHEVPELIKMSTFGIAFCRFDAGESLKGVVPTKIAEFLASGRPVVVSSGMGDLDKILQENQAGIVVQQEGDLYQAARQIQELIRNPETPENCWAVAKKYFDLDWAVQEYKATYTTLIGQHKKS